MVIVRAGLPLLHSTLRFYQWEYSTIDSIVIFLQALIRMNIFRRNTSANINTIVPALNILKINPIMIDVVFRMILNIIVEQVELYKLLQTFVQSDVALRRMVVCLGSPYSDRRTFLRWLEGEVQRALLTSREEYRAMKDCYIEIYSDIVDENEKMNIITKWCLDNKGNNKLQRVIEFIHSEDNLPRYLDSPSNEPPHYTSLYSTHYKDLPFGPRQYGGRKKSWRRRRSF